jgi:hypothetical protein
MSHQQNDELSDDLMEYYEDIEFDDEQVERQIRKALEDDYGL